MRHPIPRPLTAQSLAGLPGFRHGFFTREGGVSNGLYTGLNCGLGSKDDPSKVLENRALVAGLLQAQRPEVVTLYQVHSPFAMIIDKPIAREDLPKADAVATRTPGLAIGVLTADCTPVLFADPGAGVVAAAHAGWRGAIGGVLEAAVAAMEKLGARRQRVIAAIGPSISQAAYEVGPEFETEFLKQSEDNARFFSRPNDEARAHFDLTGYVDARLSAIGLSAVEKVAPCTYENESLFFSFRRSQHRSEADYGRQISAIVVT
jgi:polyphenol oxidase